ncbi:phosphoglycerate kinase, partial [Buchnera aphidicola]|nr:phosphoglycerate kinase [Buchnera aphidicola]
MNIRKMTELNLTKKSVLIRTDLNVPIKNGIIMSDARIRAAIPAIKIALKQNAKIIIMSHLGRPKEGVYNEKYSLKPIFNYLKEKLKPKKIFFSNNYLNGIEINYGEICVLENVRFNI